MLTFLFTLLCWPYLTYSACFGGIEWREQRRVKSERQEKEHERNRVGRDEEGNVGVGGGTNEGTMVLP
jgi:hypothetical protein